MQNPVPDERYSVADEAILGAFFKLLKKKTPDQITVSDITKTAGIARSTFYNHYQDIPSLVSAVTTVDMWVYAVPLGFFAAFVLKLPVLWVYFLLCTDEFVKWPWVLHHYRKGEWAKNITRENIFEAKGDTP